MRMILALGLLILSTVTAAAQPSAIARTPDGRPDFQGIWINDTVTPLERPQLFADKEVLSEDEATRYEKDLIGRFRDRFGDLEVTTSGELDDVWQDYGKVVPTRRTSLIVDPIDGKIPALTSQAKAREDARAEATKMHPADDPEGRFLGERCLVGLAGPPMLPPVLHGGILQVVQTPQYIVIFHEMMHDLRIVRMAEAHRSSTIRQWHGDSIGRWDGDSLVIETTNFTGKTPFRGSGEELRVIERFTRESSDTIRYDFTIDDASSFTRPWSGVLWMSRTDKRMYEYACHEGNYSMMGILRGARAAEAKSEKR